MSFKSIELVCKETIGFNIYKVFRRADRLWLCIGDEIEYKNSRKVTEYAFHVQCPWRIRKEEVLLGINDIFNPGSKIDYEEFDWSIGRQSRFDEKVAEYNKSNWNSFGAIKDVKVSKIGDLEIIFENGIVFETFIINEVKEDEWKLINFKTSMQYEVTEEKGHSK